MQQWAYTTQLTLGNGYSHTLYLDKVGTVADIYFDGTLISQVDNIYRSYYIPLPNGSGNLTIEIKSTVRESYIKASNYTRDVINVDYPLTNLWISPSWI